jgi:hypothetical protein
MQRRCCSLCRVTRSSLASHPLLTSSARCVRFPLQDAGVYIINLDVMFFGWGNHQNRKPESSSSNAHP